MTLNLRMYFNLNFRLYMVKAPEKRKVDISGEIEHITSSLITRSSEERLFGELKDHEVKDHEVICYLISVSYNMLQLKKYFYNGNISEVRSFSHLQGYGKIIYYLH